MEVVPLNRIKWLLSTRSHPRNWSPPTEKITKYTGPTQDTEEDRVFNNRKKMTEFFNSRKQMTEFLTTGKLCHLLCLGWDQCTVIFSVGGDHFHTKNFSGWDHLKKSPGI